MAQPSRALLLRKPYFRAHRLSSWTVPQALNKTEFVTAVKESIKPTPAMSALSNPDFEKIVFGVFDTITERVAAGETITITGFGKFERRYLLPTRPLRTLLSKPGLEQALPLAAGRGKQGQVATLKLRKRLRLQQR